MPVESCLNCQMPVKGNYCENCGQKTSTHRFSLTHIGHDLMHGMFHVDRGILFTLKELFSRPGYSVRAYVKGKRANHFNYFTLLILLIAVSSFIDNLSQLRLSAIINPTESENFFTAFEDFAARYPKIAVLGTIPFYALSTFLMFMKARQNFAEHLVLNTYRACGEIIISMFISLAAIFTKEITILRGIYSVVTILLFFYNTVFYWQYFKNDYRNKMLLWIRAFIAALLFIVMITLFFALIAFLLPGRN